MDIISHALWTNLAGRAAKQSHRVSLEIAAFGVMPDIVAFSYNFVTQILGNLHLEKIGNVIHMDQSLIPKITYLLFGLSHSLIIFLAVILIVALVYGKIWIPLLGWGIHILIDIVTHAAEYFPPQILFPFKTPIVDSIPWTNPYIMVPNFLLLFFIYHELHLKKHTTKLFKAVFGRLT